MFEIGVPLSIVAGASWWSTYVLPEFDIQLARLLSHPWQHAAGDQWMPWRSRSNEWKRSNSSQQSSSALPELWLWRCSHWDHPPGRTYKNTNMWVAFHIIFSACRQQWNSVTCTRYEVGPERMAGASHAMRNPLELAVTFRPRGGASGPKREGDDKSTLIGQSLEKKKWKRIKMPYFLENLTLNSWCTLRVTEIISVQETSPVCFLVNKN